MNAVAHTAFGLAYKVSTDGLMLAYTNQATGFEARISEYRFMDLVLLVLFGDRDRVDPLTKRFSLLKA
jgi:hypothetical protein